MPAGLRIGPAWHVHCDELRKEALGERAALSGIPVQNPASGLIYFLLASQVEERVEIDEY